MGQEEQLELYSRIEGLPLQALHDEATRNGIPATEMQITIVHQTGHYFINVSIT